MNIYEQIGDAAAVHAAVDRFYAKVLADDGLVGYFPPDRVDGLMEHQRVFLTVARRAPAATAAARCDRRTRRCTSGQNTSTPRSSTWSPPWSS
jgi:truncated hemoglobin YjbI